MNKSKIILLEKEDYIDLLKFVISCGYFFETEIKTEKNNHWYIIYLKPEILSQSPIQGARE